MNPLGNEQFPVIMVINNFLYVEILCTKIMSHVTKICLLFWWLHRFDAFSLGYHAYNSPVVTPLPMPSNAIVEPANFSTPITNHLSAKKRKDVKAVPDAPPPTKRSRGKLPTKPLPTKGFFFFFSFPAYSLMLLICPYRIFTFNI